MFSLSRIEKVTLKPLNERNQENECLRLINMQCIWSVRRTVFSFFIFLNERFYGAGNFYKDLFFGHLQPGVHKNLKGLAILFLEFDDVMVKALYSQ